MKKLIKALTIGSFTAALASAVALAEPAKEEKKEGDKKKKPDLAARFAKLDKNSDGFVDAEELKAGMKKNPDNAAKILKRKDKDGDGKLSKAEFTAKAAPKKKKKADDAE